MGSALGSVFGGGGGGGIFGTVLSVVGGMFGPIGMAIGGLVGNMIDQAMSSSMQDNNIPQDQQDEAQTAYRDAYRTSSGGLEPQGLGGRSMHDDIDRAADASGASAADRGQAHRLADELQQKINDFIAKGAADAAGGEEAKDAKSGKGSGGWLMAIAKALGTVAGQSAKRLVALSDEVTAASKEKNQLADDKGASAGEKGAAADRYNQAVTEMQGASQEFGLLMNAISTTIKSLGEAESGVARKQ